MSKIFEILLGLLVLKTIVGEEESPIAISQSSDVAERTAIHEDLQPNEISRTINIKIINSEPLEEAIIRSVSENDSNLKRSAEANLPLKDNESIDLTKDVEQVSEYRSGVKTQIEERSETDANDNNDSRNDFANKAALSRAEKNSDHNIEPSLPEEISRTEVPHEVKGAPDSSESEGKAMSQDVMLEVKGRVAHTPESLEEVKAISTEDARTFKSPKPLDSASLRRRLSDSMIPGYLKALSRSGIPLHPTGRSFQNRPPYFGRLTNPKSPQSRRVDDSVIDNTRRIGSYSTEFDQDLKVLEDYTDPDSNAYPYVPGAGMRPFQRIMQNDDFQRKLLDASSQQYIAQMNPYSNELSPVLYAANYPYGVNLARFQI